MFDTIITVPAEKIEFMRKKKLTIISYVESTTFITFN